MLDKLLTHPIAIAQIVLIILALLQIPYLSTAIVYLGISFYALASIIMLSTFSFTLLLRIGLVDGSLKLLLLVRVLTDQANCSNQDNSLQAQ